MGGLTVRTWLAILVSLAAVGLGTVWLAQNWRGTDVKGECFKRCSAIGKSPRWEEDKSRPPSAKTGQREMVCSCF